MIVECNHCGAPLKVRQTDRFVTCRYCDKSNRVQSLKTIAMQAHSDFSAPPAWTPPPNAVASSDRQLPYHAGAKHGATVAANRATSKLGCVIGVLCFGPLLLGLIPLLGELGACEPALEQDQAPAFGAVDVRALPQPATWMGSASGEVEASPFGADCRGYVPEAPHLLLQVPSPHEVRIWTASSTDLVLLVQGADGSVRCDDDSGDSQQPLIDAPFAAGTYRVWVGLFSRQETASFTLEVAASPLDVMPDPDGLAAAASPTLGLIDLDASPSGNTREGTVAGVVEARELWAGCQGYLPRAPHLIVKATPTDPFFVTTRSDADLTLYVRGPTGTSYCDDDSGESNQPRLELPPGGGEYRIWVGAFHQEEEARFELDVGALGK